MEKIKNLSQKIRICKNRCKIWTRKIQYNKNP